MTYTLSTEQIQLWEESFWEGVSELLIPYQMRSPNASRLLKRPSTKSCMVVVLAKQMVRRTRRLIRVRSLINTFAKMGVRQGS